MPVFSYKGYNSKTGDSVKGKIEAENTRAARQKLKSSDGIIVADIKEEAAGAVSQKGGQKKLLDFSLSTPKSEHVRSFCYDKAVCNSASSPRTFR